MTRYVMLSLLILSLSLVTTPSTGLAQSEDISIETLAVQLWPEYDRASVLVIYQVELSRAVDLPVELTFRLPNHIEEIHAVAIDYEDQGLLSILDNLIQLRPDGAYQTVSFPVDAYGVQFEYYDPVILTRQGDARQFDYQFVTDYPTQSATFEIQVPAETTTFSMQPDPTEALVGNDGLNYQVVATSALAVDAPFEVSVQYRRATNELSVDLIGRAPLPDIVVNPPGEDLTAPPIQMIEPSTTPGTYFAYILIGIGLALFLGTGGYWWWVSRQTVPVEVTQPMQNAPKFCYNCGTSLRAGASFCHQCGANQQRDV